MAVAGVALVVVTLSAQGNEKPSEAFSKAMRDNGEAVRALRAASKEFEESGAGAQDFDPFEKAAATMRASFTTTLTYWQAQKVDDAVELDRAGAQTRRRARGRCQGAGLPAGAGGVDGVERDVRIVPYGAPRANAGRRLRDQAEVDISRIDNSVDLAGLRSTGLFKRRRPPVATNQRAPSILSRISQPRISAPVQWPSSCSLSATEAMIAMTIRPWDCWRSCCWPAPPPCRRTILSRRSSTRANRSRCEGH